MAWHFDYRLSASESDNQSVRSSEPANAMKIVNTTTKLKIMISYCLDYPPAE